MLNISSSSVLFFIDTLSSPSSHVVSFSPAISSEIYGLTSIFDQSTLHEKTRIKEIIFALTKDLHISVVESSNGNVIGSVSKDHKESTAISMHILGKRTLDTGTLIAHISRATKLKVDSNTYNDVVLQRELSASLKSLVGNRSTVKKLKHLKELLIALTDILIFCQVVRTCRF